MGHNTSKETNMERWEKQISEAREKGLNWIVVEMVTRDEEKLLNEKGYTIEYIGGGATALSYGSRDYNYLIKW